MTVNAFSFLEKATEKAREKTILIVDDLPDNLRVLSTALAGQGFKIRCAKNGAIALMAVQTTSPDLILLDIKMPDLDGYEVCQRLKSTELTRDIPVIFLSALDDAFDQVKAFKVGGVDYITKPFHVEEVLIRVRHQLDLQAAKAEIQQLNQELEQRVEQRTAQLAKINEQLCLEVIERQHIEESLRVSEERLENILSSLEDVVWSVAADYSQIFYLNSAVEKVYGYSIASFLGNPNFRLQVIHSEDRDRIEDAAQAMLTTGHLCEEYRILRSTGEVRWVNDRSHVIYDADGKALRINGIVRDITEQKLAQQQLIYDALHDALTGLPNRNLFMDRVEQTLKHSKRHSGYLFAILFIDLDRFKMINDSLGHATGDRFLQAIAKLLESCLRPSDTVARFGGDEFTILIDDIQDPSEAIVIAERILNKFLTPVDLGDQTIFTSASIGIVISTKDYSSGADLVRDADIAMYCAKSLGRGRYILFDSEMYEQNLKLMQIDSDLRYAIERQEFELHYQPFVALETNKLVGFEALIRWRHPERGLVSPAEFIPVAEDSGLIVAIGDWVMHEACQQLRKWQTLFPETTTLKMSINLASHQVRENNLIEKLDRVLAETGIAGSALCLEITESTLMDRSELAIDKLRQLRTRNIQLSIDDFGQGYSSLGYLRRFPINTLKIDRAFIDRMAADAENLEIVRTIVVLAKTLSMSVVAEGVENQQQVMMLKQLDCKFAQGYFFSRPLPVSALEQAIATKILEI
ncbi:EAL domain-containing protein [Tumidithrix helvetica PCC 7403]|uniref:two-component system response regulator n=1 Tax=Tumidithrix helvetica TaxID=3457545 RepID=UPI003C8C77A0